MLKEDNFLRVTITMRVLRAVQNTQQSTIIGRYALKAMMIKK